MAYPNEDWGLEPGGAKLMAGVQRGMEPVKEDIMRRIPGMLAKMGWDAPAIKDVMSSMSEKWGAAFAGPAFAIGKQELGQEWATGERVSSEADALRRLRMGLQGSLEQIRLTGRIQKERAEEEWGRYESLAESMKPGKWDWLKQGLVGAGGTVAGGYAGKLMWD